MVKPAVQSGIDYLRAMSLCFLVVFVLVLLRLHPYLKVSPTDQQASDQCPLASLGFLGWGLQVWDAGGSKSGMLGVASLGCWGWGYLLLQ